MVVMKEEKLCVCQGPLSCLPVVTVSCGHVALAAARSVRTDRTCRRAAPVGPTRLSAYSSKNV